MDTKKIKGLQMIKRLKSRKIREVKYLEKDDFLQEEPIIVGNKKGMELVQVGILIAIAIVVGLIFRSEIMSFVQDVFSDLKDGF